MLATLLFGLPLGLLIVWLSVRAENRKIDKRVEKMMRERGYY